MVGFITCAAVLLVFMIAYGVYAAWRRQRADDAAFKRMLAETGHTERNGRLHGPGFKD